MKTTENLYQLIFESARDGIILSDLEKGKVLVANPIAAKMHGYSHKVFCGLTLQRLINEQALPLLKEDFNAIKQGKPIERVVKNIHKDGSQFWVEWRAEGIK